MTKQILAVVLSALLAGLLACNSKKDSKTSQQDITSAQKIDTTKTIFMTWTIANALPEMKKRTDTCALIPEGSWRQFEFISKDQKSSIEKEFVKIQDVEENYQVDAGTYTGFSKVAVRDLIIQPLSVSFSKLKSCFKGIDIRMQALGLENNAGQVKNGFYFEVYGVSYYGLLDNDTVKAFCIYSAETDSELKTATKYLSILLSTEKLYLVDWSTRIIYDEKTIITELVH